MILLINNQIKPCSDSLPVFFQFFDTVSLHGWVGSR